MVHLARNRPLCPVGRGALSETPTLARVAPLSIDPDRMRYVFDVVVDMLHPVRARAGQVLVVRPGTAQPMLVVRHGTTDVIREGPPNYGALLVLLDEGVIRERTVGARAALSATA